MFERYELIHPFKNSRPPLYPEIDYQIIKDKAWGASIYILLRTYIRIHRNKKWYKILVQTSEASTGTYDIGDLYNRLNTLCYRVARFYKPRPEDLDTDQQSEKSRIKPII